jgi:hypothetical protein
MRVLLINPSYPFEEFPRLLVTMPYVASALQSEGHEVEILDLLLSRTTPEKIERRMSRFRPQVVGITSVTLNHHIAASIAEVVRKCDGGVPIVMGGPHVSFEIEGSFRDLPALDYIAIGEGEHTMRELCRALEGRMDLRDIKGLALRDGDRVVKNAPRPLEDDLDTLPEPARHLLPVARYLAFDSHASVVTSRGCPYSCIFCSAPAWTGRQVRYRRRAVRRRDREARGLASPRSPSRTTSSRSTATLPRRLRRADPARHGDSLERVLAGRHDLARDREHHARGRLPGDLLRRRERQPGDPRSREEEVEPREGERGDADDPGRGHHRARLVHHRPARRDRGDAAQDRRVRERAPQRVRLALRLHILAPFPGTEVRDSAAEYGLEILSNDWTKYDANHVVTRTKGATPGVLQAVADEYDSTMDRYLSYQDYLYKAGQLSGYELKMYLRRHRQALLWKLLLNDTIEGLPAFRNDPVAELHTAVAEATGVRPEFASSELDRVLALCALRGSAGPDGTRFGWTE